MRTLTASLCLALVPMAASAHPDHTGSAVTGWLHLLDPFHLGLAGVALAAAVALRSGLRLARARR